MVNIVINLLIKYFGYFYIYLIYRDKNRREGGIEISFSREISFQPRRLNSWYFYAK